ncbi:MAG: sugar ABC transporter permease [Oscillospiraceae bacterium]|nr:sugar ABC transporter permease [Oscillospiraceae bacterium]
MTDAKKRKGLTLMQRRAVTGLLFVSPFIFGFLVFYVRSLWMTLEFAFSETSTEGLGYSLSFVGLDNFVNAFTQHPRFNQVLVDSIGSMVIDVPLIIFFSLFIAIILNQKFKGRTVARAIFFLPVLLNAPAVFQALETARAFMIGGASAAPSGLVDSLAGSASGVNIGYYIDMLREMGMPMAILDYIIGAVTRINYVITMSGVQIIIFLASLQAISPALYEVAKIEGATPYETFWKITFPMVSPLLVTNMVYTVLDSFVNSRVLQESYDAMFGTAQDYSLSAAFSLISMVCVCGILGIASWLVSKRVYYHN